MLITGKIRQSRLAVCLAAAPQFLLSETETLEIIEAQVRAIGKKWDDSCDLANLSDVDRKLLWGRQFLNGYAFENLQGNAGAIAALMTEVLGRVARQVKTETVQLTETPVRVSYRYSGHFGIGP